MLPYPTEEPPYVGADEGTPEFVTAVTIYSAADTVTVLGATF